ncbi:CaiB/BaiF CoA transferase family protein [Kordiimonas marina]|uniref:CaiB/BaiF CoA transferase family protein n=1 Tax=Kordiimonas marina TaxID=2872312 RepID=UPI001FF57330|nr:CaiB/BaiF CoA-transferase family protein [Kordiimonas marina]MCJ9430689.1 CoA transferase [Kordiimonas marina]
MGPLKGTRIIELVGMGPGPFCGMMLADMGAEVIAIDRMGGGGADLKVDINRRGKRSIRLNLKSEEGRQALLKLVEGADALFEGFRPGVIEKLGLGPDVLMAANPKLVIGRMTGWGQTGPLAHTAGHDINYISLAGALHAMGPANGVPTPPLNLVGDYGGGGVMLAFGLVCGILEARTSGKGQVIDVSMVEGASLLMSIFHSLMASHQWAPGRGINFLDGGAHFYGTYETKDGGFVSLGAIEPQFMQEFITRAGLDASWMGKHMNPAHWGELKAELATLFKTKTRDEWTAIFDGSDACFAPVLPFWEAHKHPHNVARGSFVEVDGLTQPGPMPKFSRTEPEISHGPVAGGADTDALLAEAGFDAEAIKLLRDAGAVA